MVPGLLKLKRVHQEGEGRSVNALQPVRGAGHVKQAPPTSVGEASLTRVVLKITALMTGRARRIAGHIAPAGKRLFHGQNDCQRAAARIPRALFGKRMRRQRLRA